MKKAILFIICVLTLSGCSNLSNTVSREDYESTVSEIDTLKSQIESSENENEENIETQQHVEDNEFIHEENALQEKKLLGESTFEWDENNVLSLSVYRNENNNIYVNGTGIYEEGNLGLLQDDYNYIFVVFFNALFANEVEVSFIIGTDEYLFSVLNGEVISDNVPMEERETEPQKYIANGKLAEHGEQIMEFYNSITQNP